MNWIKELPTVEEFEKLKDHRILVMVQRVVDEKIQNGTENTLVLPALFSSWDKKVVITFSEMFGIHVQDFHSDTHILLGTEYVGSPKFYDGHDGFVANTKFLITGWVFLKEIL